ncbi:MAG: hypothetical protein RL595_2329, partial [Planctomycetota bacterium]
LRNLGFSKFKGNSTCVTVGDEPFYMLFNTSRGVAKCPKHISDSHTHDKACIMNGHTKAFLWNE